MSSHPLSQARYWIATIPAHAFTPYLPPGLAYARGQLESGAETHFVHWQCVFVCDRKRRLGWLRDTFGPYHFEPTRSSAALEYVWKDDTRVGGTQFELGQLPVNRSSSNDWERIWESAKRDDLDGIPCDVRIRCYHQLRRIATDHCQPVAMRRTATVYWGPPETGKSRRAAQEAGDGYYVKDPRTKWFGGYRGQSTAVIDEFRGSIDVTHLLRWFDRYPVLVETKGGFVPLCVRHWFVTSNLHPRDWYPDLDPDTFRALMRRLTVVHVPIPLYATGDDDESE